MEYLKYLIDLVLHFDEHLQAFIEVYDTWTYLLLFVIIFCETGLVVTPILPGDSLLFAAGVVAAHTPTIHLPMLGLMLCLAANAGDLVNYTLGYCIGPRIFSSPTSRWLNKKY